MQVQLREEQMIVEHKKAETDELLVQARRDRRETLCNHRL